MSTTVFLPDQIANWVTARLPLVDLSKVRFRVRERIPFWWMAPKRTFNGLTLWNRVYLVNNCWQCDPVTPGGLELILHELVHVAQYRRNPVVFPVRYLINHFRYGYDRNPAEVEARETASRLAASFFSG
ncbi:MAG TPA: DUF4157 domain-containing protein [Terriglobia bacterium]|nr:DUF4157 domain-containing protein [Terriglobia bacterium]